MTKDEALRLALEALKETWYHVGTFSPTDEAIELYDKAIRAIKEALETKDEPVALVAEVHISRYTVEWTNGPLPENTKLYTTPQRKPLTDKHIDEIPFALFEQDQNGISATEALREFARAIEAAHGIKE